MGRNGKKKRPSRKNRSDESGGFGEKDDLPRSELGLIPRIQNPRGRVTLRFVASAAISFGPILGSDFLNWWMFASSTTNVYRVCQAVRLRAVRLYSGINAATNNNENRANEIAWQWESEQGPALTQSTQSVGVSTGEIRTRPPRNSFAGMWMQSGSTAEAKVISIVSLPILGVMDLTFDYVVNLGTFTPMNQTTSGVTAGISAFTIFSGTTAINLSDAIGW